MKYYDWLGGGISKHLIYTDLSIKNQQSASSHDHKELTGCHFTAYS